MLKAQPVEDALGARAGERLSEAGLLWAWVEQSGRDSYVYGHAADAGRRDSALQAVSAVWGVRRAHDRMTLADDGEPIGSQDACQSAFDAALTGRTVEFETGSAQIDPVSRPLLRELASLTRRCAGFALVVAGHTDNTGEEDFNRSLSEARAGAVAAYLISAGANAAGLSATGYGSTRPIADNTSEDGRALNRRVEFRVATAPNGG
ncbi:MAG: OmpA family protein [Pseudomonadota bacterium]